MAARCAGTAAGAGAADRCAHERNRKLRPESNIDVFRQALQELGWTEGRNVQIDIRWAGGDPAEIRRHAEDLVAPAPDVVVVTGNAGMPPILRATATVPVVFNNIADPVGAGFVDSSTR